ncbi:Rap30/74 interaction domain-containing protein [Nadsonia fulvescens var. elongata DSM 6958]|uniref:Transcription initiation factor IIF subunit alpha n=1 Tax=Nadsonia fulvescens var. elongata DSM 6958 TaxID=857566 RepID=A0A1E3PMD4_9ASCO|nr:Rap30/74 interaction domain-containing protein [Nadsonia fulvescens var. elongata DSM 6958]
MSKSRNTTSPLRRTVISNPLVKRESGLGNSAQANRQRFNNSRAAKKAAKEEPISYTDFKLRACSDEDIKDMRYHIMKLHSNKNVNPMKDFAGPIRLHRKDPQNIQFQLTQNEINNYKQNKISQGLGGGTDMGPSISGHDSSPGLASAPDGESMDGDVKVKAENGDDKGKGVKDGDSKEGEKDEEKKEAPSVDMSIVAPDGGARKPKKNPFQKKTRQVILGDENARKLRYEEYYPWVLEDFDGKNTWVGSYEAAQSDTFALFVFDKDGFKMVPAEKYYRFTPRNQYATLTLDEAEEQMEAKNNVPRWLMRHMTPEVQDSRMRGQRKRFLTVDDGGRNRDPEEGSRREAEDEDLDFDEEFADDEEAPIMEGHEDEVRDVEKRMKKNMRSANILGIKDVKEEDLEDENSNKVDQEGKKLKKYLRSLEKNTFYESDDEENPYASEEEESEIDEETKINVEDGVATVKKEPGEKSSKQNPSKFNSLSGLDMKPLVKKTFTNLPPGFVILQLPSRQLSQFPKDVWNPSAKLRRIETTDLKGDSNDDENTHKKIKLSVESQSQNTPADSPGVGLPINVGSPVAAIGVSSETTQDVNILTEDDVRNAIASKKLTAKELLATLRQKIRKHPENPSKLKTLVKKLAKLQDGVLILKDGKSG